MCFEVHSVVVICADLTRLSPIQPQMHILNLFESNASSRKSKVSTAWGQCSTILNFWCSVTTCKNTIYHHHNHIHCNGGSMHKKCDKGVNTVEEILCFLFDNRLC